MKRTVSIFLFFISLMILLSSGCSRFNQDTNSDNNDREESASASIDDDSENDSDATLSLGSIFGKSKDAEEAGTEPVEEQDEEATEELNESESNEAQETITTAAATEPAQNAESEPAESDYILPYSDTKILTYEDIADLSIEEIPYARNEIYARHGYPFQKESYIEYFGSKDWYQINPDFKESDLTEIEKSNVEFLKGYEQR